MNCKGIKDAINRYLSCRYNGVSSGGGMINCIVRGGNKKQVPNTLIKT